MRFIICAYGGVVNTLSLSLFLSIHSAPFNVLPSLLAPKSLTSNGMGEDTVAGDWSDGERCLGPCALNSYKDAMS